MPACRGSFGVRADPKKTHLESSGKLCTPGYSLKMDNSSGCVTAVAAKLGISVRPPAGASRPSHLDSFWDLEIV